MEEIILVGYGGHAQSIADCIERDGRFRIIGYTEKEEQPSPYVYLGTDDVLKSFWEQGIKNVAVGDWVLGKRGFAGTAILYSEINRIPNFRSL